MARQRPPPAPPAADKRVTRASTRRPLADRLPESATTSTTTATKSSTKPSSLAAPEPVKPKPKPKPKTAAKSRRKPATQVEVVIERAPARSRPTTRRRQDSLPPSAAGSDRDSKEELPVKSKAPPSYAPSLSGTATAVAPPLSEWSAPPEPRRPLSFSLPPSSPPPLPSSPLVPTVPFPPTEIDDNEVVGITDDIGGHDIEWDDEQPDMDSDPFGFFAAEQKLKAMREEMGEEPELDSLSFEKSSSEIHLDLPPAASARGRRSRGSTRSQPSQVPSRHSSTPAHPPASSPSTTPRVANSNKGKQRGTSPDESRVFTTEALEALLPRRRPRHLRQRPRGHRKQEVESDDEDLTEKGESDDDFGGGTRKKRKKGKKAMAGKKVQPRGKGKGKEEDEGDDEEREFIHLDPDEREKAVIEKHERLDFFKQLDDYELETEIVV
ncbi:hypothetical protein BOTBODRAFT_175079 [Botryobasidium botryosum FD-172 SS1]|uniref:Uncharacterized protein n=1 Tax=Botryobasidium botryosum (strain FD-172 SS1) TaxID=930990 RepID=A0A067MEI5_BOTB1|nr:hypothetical protein BOTBODRAFT_175079 [Botryobasidium botryosum FD-172 SS1]